MGVIPSDSPKLLNILNLLHDSNHLWTRCGIRSLSISDKFFGEGENYWKGPIWININYLVVASLYKNYIHSGPYKDKAKEIYQQLRTGIIHNIFSEYRRTGYVWEQYHPITCQGQRSHPFTGWTALVVLMMAEIYP